MRAVDCVPIAVVLLSQLAQHGNRPSLLLKRWNQTYSRLLRTAATGREYNVEVSISLSLNFLPSLDADPGPLHLLSVCSELPDGLFEPVFEQLRRYFHDIDDSADILKRHALVYVGPAGELKMLSPIRLLILRDYPVSDVHATVLRRIYFAIAADAPTELDQRFEERAAKLVQEYGNVMAFLLHLANGGGDATRDLFNATLTMTDFSYWRLPSCTLARALVPKLRQHPESLAKLLYSCGRCHSMRNEYSDALACFTAARSHFEDLGQRDQVAACSLELGNAYRLFGSFGKAEANIGLAYDISRGMDEQIDAAQCMRILGGLFRTEGLLDAAEDQLRAALSVFTQAGNLLHSANTRCAIGELLRVRGEYSSAKAEIAAAQAEYEALGDQLGVATCFKNLGIVSRQEGNINDALQELEAARELYSTVGYRLGLAHTAYNLALVRRDLQQFGEGHTQLKLASDLYKELGLRKYVQMCDKAIGSSVAHS